MQKYINNAVAALGSRWALYAILMFFALEALWFAFSAVYPMAFDEQYHLGIIEIYAQQWLPFLSEQPAGADVFGAVARDGSYLYHYLMSFPYRVVTWITDSVMHQIIILRCINIALFVAALVVFRKVLRLSGLSSALTNFSLAVFVLIPIVPHLAAHINYDNLLLLLTALTLLFAIRIHEKLKQRILDVWLLAVLLATGVLASLVKYVFLPIFFSVVMFVAIRIVQTFGKNIRDYGRAAKSGYRKLTTLAKVGLLAFVLIASGLFVQRFGVNMVVYKTPVPACDQVLSVERCMAYPPFRRDADNVAKKDNTAFSPNPFEYTAAWLHGMWYRLFFAISAAPGYTNYPPLPWPGTGMIVIAAVGVAAAGAAWRVLRKNQILLLFGLVTIVYCGVLWVENYSAFLHTGQRVAINGRYLLLVMLPVAAIMGIALSHVLRKAAILKTALAAFVLLLFLNGGGVFTFILRSDPSWYWQTDSALHANEAAQTILRPIMSEGSKSCSENFSC